jgi:hypothetical protein
MEALKIEFTSRNVSSVLASRAELWVEICNVCSFVTEPEHFDNPSKDELIRHRMFGDINPGVSMEKMGVSIGIPAQYQSCDISFKYSCANCENDDKIQTLHVILKR